MKKLYLVLMLLSMVGIIPSLYIGVSLAERFGTMLLIPVPTMVLCILFGVFGYKLERSL